MNKQKKFNILISILVLVSMVLTMLGSSSAGVFIKKKSSAAEKWLKEGWNYADMGNYALAIDSYNKAIEASPSLADGYYGRGEALNKRSN